MHKTGKINKVYSYCINCDFIKTKIIYGEDLNYFLEELSAHDVLRFHVLKDFDWRFNDALENTYGKGILEGLYLIKTDKHEIDFKKKHLQQK